MGDQRASIRVSNPVLGKEKESLSFWMPPQQLAPTPRSPPVTSSSNSNGTLNSSTSISKSTAKLLGVKDNRDPTGKPKRMLNAYNFFFHQERIRLAQAQADPRKDDGDFPGLAKHVASQWKLLAPSDKEPYQRLAEQDKVRFQKEMDEWKAITKRKRKQFKKKTENMTKNKKSRVKYVQAAMSTQQLHLEPTPISGAATHAQLNHVSPSSSNSCQEQEEDPYRPTPAEVKELANRLGKDGVDIVIRLFLG